MTLFLRSLVRFASTSARVKVRPSTRSLMERKDSVDDVILREREHHMQRISTCAAPHPSTVKQVIPALCRLTLLINDMSGGACVSVLNVI